MSRKSFGAKALTYPQPVFLIVIELNKNTLVGFILTGALLVSYFLCKNKIFTEIKGRSALISGLYLLALIAISGEKLNAEEILNGYNGDECTAFILFDKFTADNFSEKLKGYCGDVISDTNSLAEGYEINNNDDAKKAMSDILSAVWFGYGHRCLTRKAIAENIPVYEYYFNQKNGRLSNWHSGEEVYCYGNIPVKSRLYSEDDRIISSIMLTYWRNFAATGNPNADEEGSNKVFDVYNIWGSRSEEPPALPNWGQANDIDKITEFKSEVDTYVRISDSPYQSIYKALDKAYNIR